MAIKKLFEAKDLNIKVVPRSTTASPAVSSISSCGSGVLLIHGRQSRSEQSRKTTSLTVGRKQLQAKLANVVWSGLFLMVVVATVIVVAALAENVRRTLWMKGFMFLWVASIHFYLLTCPWLSFQTFRTFVHLICSYNCKHSFLHVHLSPIISKRSSFAHHDIFSYRCIDVMSRHFLLHGQTFIMTFHLLTSVHVQQHWSALEPEMINQLWSQTYNISMENWMLGRHRSILIDSI